MILAWNVAACLRFSFLQEISSYCQCFSGTCWDLKILNSIKEPLTAAVEVRSWTYHFPHICNERHLLVSFCETQFVLICCCNISSQIKFVLNCCCNISGQTERPEKTCYFWEEFHVFWTFQLILVLLMHIEYHFCKKNRSSWPSLAVGPPIAKFLAV